MDQDRSLEQAINDTGMGVALAAVVYGTRYKFAPYIAKLIGNVDLKVSIDHFWGMASVPIIAKGVGGLVEHAFRNDSDHRIGKFANTLIQTAFIGSAFLLQTVGWEMLTQPGRRGYTQWEQVAADCLGLAAGIGIAHYDSAKKHLGSYASRLGGQLRKVKDSLHPADF